MGQQRIPLKGQDKSPPAERIAASSKRLIESSKEVNAAATELGAVVASIEASLNSINPAVSAWHTIADGGSDDGNQYWHRDIGYSQVKNVWAVFLRQVEGDYRAPDLEESESFLFKDAPRWMQIESINKIPDLVDALIKRTEETAKKLQSKTLEAQELAEALAKVAAEQSLEGW